MTQFNCLVPNECLIVRITHTHGTFCTRIRRYIPIRIVAIVQSRTARTYARIYRCPTHKIIYTMHYVPAVWSRRDREIRRTRVAAFEFIFSSKNYNVKILTPLYCVQFVYDGWCWLPRGYAGQWFARKVDGVGSINPSVFYTTFYWKRHCSIGKYTIFTRRPLSGRFDS